MKKKSIPFIFLLLFNFCLIPVCAVIQVNIMDYGAVGDGKTDNTTAIQSAINACNGTSGGGTVIVPADTFWTRPLFMKSNVNLHLEEGAIILGSPERQDYIDAFPNASDINSSAVIYASGQSNVSVTGKGTIDGQGWASSFQLGNGGSKRPKVLHMVSCKNVLIQDVTLRNSAFWTSHFLTCDGVKIKGIKIYSHSNWNNDGIDIDSKNVEVSDCYVDCDDDGICLKSDRAVICENVTIKNCIVSSNCNALKFGTAGKSGFKNVKITNCVVRKASEDNIRHWKTSLSWARITSSISVVTGIAVESVDGGTLDGVLIDNIVMSDVQTPIFIRLGDRARGTNNVYSSLKNVVIKNIFATSNSLIAGSITGLTASRVTNVQISNVHINSPGGGTSSDASASVSENASSYPENRMFGIVLPASGFYVRHVDGISFDNIRINNSKTDLRPAFNFNDVLNYKLTNCTVNNGLQLVKSTNSTEQQ